MDGDTEFSPVYFNSATKTVINSEFNIDKSFQEILCKIDNWINEGSGWIVESIDGEYVNISAYSPLVGSTYIELLSELKNSMKGLINIKNNDNKCFLWCHVRHLNFVGRNPQRITRKDKELVNKLHYKVINFPVSKKDCCRIEMQNKICINVLCYDNELTYSVYLLDQKFNDDMDLLLIPDECKSHYVYIKDFDRFMFNETKNKTRKYFCKCYLQCFSNEEILIEHKTYCLVIINGKQNVRLQSGTISVKNYFKQMPVPFKIYADFECILKKVESKSSEYNSNSSYTRKYQDHIPRSFSYKIVCIDNKFSKKVVLYIGKKAVYKFIKSILSEYNYCKKVIKKHFNKNRIMYAEEERFQLSNISWICNKLFDVSDNKVRDHWHVTGKYRGAAHWSCNVNFKMTKKVPVIFHNLKAMAAI